MELSTAQELRIAVRYVGRPSGEQVLEMTVPCPMTGGRVYVDECSECAHGGGLVLGPVGEGSFLRCRFGASPPAPGVRPRRPRWEPTAASRTPVSDIMSTQVVTVTRGTTLETVMGAFLERRISGMPVVDDDGRPIGLISKTDVLRDRYDGGWAGEQGWGESAGTPEEDGTELEYRQAPKTVDDVMTPVVYMLSGRAPVAMAAAVMAAEGIHRLPIVSDEGRLTGILSSTDLMRWLSVREGYILPPAPKV